MPPQEAGQPLDPPPAHLHVPLGLSPHSSPAAKIKYSICIAGKSCKSLLSLSSCSRNIGGVIFAGACPTTLCSSLARTVLPFPHISLWDALEAGGGAGPRCPWQSNPWPEHPMAPTLPALPAAGVRACACPRAVRDGDASTWVTDVVPPECPPSPPCPWLTSRVPSLSLPLRQACAKSIVQNYVFKYLGFHQLCKLSPSIKAAVWVLHW